MIDSIELDRVEVSKDKVIMHCYCYSDGDNFHEFSMGFEAGSYTFEDGNFAQIYRDIAAIFGISYFATYCRKFKVNFAVSRAVVENILKLADKPVYYIFLLDPNIDDMDVEFCKILPTQPSLPVRRLDREMVALGNSGGKESILCDYILKKAGYQIQGIYFSTFAKEKVQADLKFFYSISQDMWTDLNQELIKPRTDHYIRIQELVSITRLLWSVLLAYQKGCGQLAIGSEWSRSKTWYRNEFPYLRYNTGDLAADEGKEAALDVEAFFQEYNLEMYIISPVAMLHETAIIRMLVEKDLVDLKDLKSCWWANVLNTNYCGHCLKCQRMKFYFDYLGSRFSDYGYTDSPNGFNSIYKNVLPFPDLGIATGSSLTSSIQNHIFLDNPDLPWASCLLIDQGYMFLDYRTGSRIFKAFKSDFFVDTIFTDAYPCKPEVRMQPTATITGKIEQYTGINYRELYNIPFEGESKHTILPFERIIQHSLMTEGKVVKGCALDRLSEVPIFADGEWKNIPIKGSGSEKLELKSDFMDNYKIWFSPYIL